MRSGLLRLSTEITETGPGTEKTAVLEVTTPVRRNDTRSLELRTPNGPAMLTQAVTR
ncbi:hypothetical protein [Saccharopolyspora sp. NPDC049357]|uniref:hypothetical protein n=1 Tax=Saccharopolyspora sp. NPDC049357 TaxID=3154507 RepID=UPI00343EB554